MSEDSRLTLVRDGLTEMTDYLVRLHPAPIQKDWEDYSAVLNIHARLKSIVGPEPKEETG